MTTTEAPPDTRQPPADVHAEAALLGACLRSPVALDTAAEAVGARDFYRPAHGEVFAAMLDMREHGVEVDPVTLAHHLGDRLFKLGDEQRRGAPWLADLYGGTPSAGNVGFYAEIIADKSVRRRLVAAAQRTHQLAYADGGETADVVERARQALDEVAQSARGGDAAVEAVDLADDALARYASEAEPALSTGWGDLDMIMSGGLRPGTMTVVGARPGVGKSVVGCNVPLAAGLRGHGSLIVSLEMTTAELTDRLIANLATVELTRLMRRQLTSQDWDAVQVAADRLRDLPIAVNDDPHLGMAQIRSHARDRARSPVGLSLLVVDYLGLVRPAETRNVPRQEQVAAISRGLKLLAKELRVPVLALHQLNRGPEQRADKRPAMADLRESGAIEQDADSVWLLHRSDEDDKRYEIEINVAKNRQGRVGTVHLPWTPQYARVGWAPQLDEAS
jgi:replicative DNA helicase